MNNKVVASNITATSLSKAEINPEHVRIGLIGADRSLMNIGKGPILGEHAERLKSDILYPSFKNVGNILFFGGLLTGLIYTMFWAGQTQSACLDEKADIMRDFHNSINHYFLKWLGIIITGNAMIHLSNYYENHNLGNKTKLLFNMLESYIDNQMFNLFRKFEQVSNDKIVKILKQSLSKNLQKVLALAGYSAQKDKTVIKSALYTVSSNEDLKAVMNLAKFDAWNDRELLIIIMNRASYYSSCRKETGKLALSNVSNLDNIKAVIELGKFDAWNDKEVVKVALSRVSGSDVVKVMDLAMFDAWNEKELVKVALSRVSSLAGLKEIMSLAKFEAWNDKKLVTVATKHIYEKLSDIFLTKVIGLFRTKENINLRLVRTVGECASTTQSGESDFETVYDIKTTHFTTYGFDEAKADELLKGFPQVVIDEVKKQLANKTRTETTTS